MSDMNLVLNTETVGSSIDRPIICAKDLSATASRMEIERVRERRWLASALMDIFDDETGDRELDALIEN